MIDALNTLFSSWLRNRKSRSMPGKRPSLLALRSELLEQRTLLSAGGPGGLTGAAPPAAAISAEQAIALAINAQSEVGTNDFQISHQGCDVKFDATPPAVAYNSKDNEYLVVWSGDGGTTPLMDDNYQIYGQRISAATGAALGTNDFSISEPGHDLLDPFNAYNPAVSYNSTNNEYLVVWSGESIKLGFFTGSTAFDIYGQRLSADGTEIGTDDFQISDMGPLFADVEFAAFNPAVAYNNTRNEYLVVWEGDGSDAPLVDNEFEIFGQRLSAAGAEVGTDDFRVSDMGPNGNTAFEAFDAAVAYNSTNNEYLVVWTGDDNTAPLVDNEFEIFGQRLSAVGTQIGTNDFRISDMGPNGSTSYGASRAAVTYNSTINEYLVVWSGDDNTGSLVDDEFEIFGQRLKGTGNATGANDFRISDIGPNGSTTNGAGSPAVTYNSANNEYLVVWDGDDGTAPLANDEFEVFGQRLDAVGAQIGANDFRISGMGPDGDPAYAASTPAVAYASNQFLVVWVGDDNTLPLVDEEFEIFGQRLSKSGTETGADDFRISDMGGDFSNAQEAAVAYNSTNKEYLVVWSGDDDRAPFVNGEYEIFGQRLDAATGAAIGANFRISDMGPNGDANFGAVHPAVAYNSRSNEYLVVWEGDDNTGSLVVGENEIFGQRLDATGAEIGTNDFRISDMGSDGNSEFGAFDPAVAYNSTRNEYLVAWWGDDNTAPLASEEFEIFGQRLKASGVATGTNDFRISDMGPNGSTMYGADSPAVTYNSANNEYLVVWAGDDNTAPLVNDEVEIFGQRLDAAGTQIGTNDFRISDMGPNGSARFFALYPDAVYNSTKNEYLVVWSGDDNTGSLVDNEFEVFGQRLDAAGAEIGANDFRISDMGPDGDVNFEAYDADVVYNSTNNEYLVAWQGDDNTGSLVDWEYEIYGQRLSSDGAEIGENDFRISDMGPDGDDAFDARQPAAAYNSANNEYLLAWQGDDNTSPLLDNEFEIHGQRIALDQAVAASMAVDNSALSLMAEPQEIAAVDHFFEQLGASRKADRRGNRV